MHSILKRLRRALSHCFLPKVIRQVKTQHLTYLEEEALLDLYRTAQHLDATAVPGVFVEAGCALGGSAIVIATAKNTARQLFVYDVFGMIPPPSEQDDADVHTRYREISEGKSEGIAGDRYYGYEENLREKVASHFRRFELEPDTTGIHLVQGLFQDTIQLDQPVALAHLDGDWYDSIMVCLRRIEPQLALGGLLVIDDYEAWSGCRKAVDEYFRDKRDRYEFVRKSRLHIIRRH